MRRSYTSRVLLVSGAMGLLLAAARCVGPETSAAPPRRIPRPPLTAHRVSAVVAKGLLPHGIARVNWMAEIHTAAMQRGLAHRSELGALGPKQRCALIEGVVRSFIPAITNATGISDQAFYERAVEQARGRNRCASGGPLSVWGLPSALVTTQGEGVTGEFQTYIPAMQNAIENSDSPAAAAAGIDATLAQASELGAPDFEVLAAIASGTASSVYYWDEVEQSGGGGGSGPPNQMAIFGRLCGFWCRVGGLDLVGMVGGALAVVYTAGPGAVVAPQAVAAGAIIGGAFASLSAAF